MRPKINTPPSVELPANTFTTCPNCGVKYWVGTWHSCPVRQTAVKWAIIGSMNNKSPLSPVKD